MQGFSERHHAVHFEALILKGRILLFRGLHGDLYLTLYGSSVPELRKEAELGCKPFLQFIALWNPGC